MDRTVRIRTKNLTAKAERIEPEAGSDREQINAIAAASKQNHYRLRTVIEHLVT